jgi:hypothetical protein
MEPAMWKAINLQLITFPLDPQACLTANWWENLTGLNEYESSKKRLERTDDGQYLNFGLKLEMDLLRVSWTRGPIASDVLTGVINDDAADGMRNLGEFNGASQEFRGIMHRWLVTECPPIYRMSFAGHLTWRQESREAAYTKLGDFLPMKPDPQATEFLYQINRKKASAVIDAEINRLRTWSANKFEVVYGIEGQVAGNSFVEFGCSLRFDINNSPDPNKKPLPREKLCGLFDELLESAAQIASNGDTA